MNNMDQTSQMLLFLLAGAFIILFILIIVYVFLNRNQNKMISKVDQESKGKSGSKTKIKGKTKSYDGKQSIFNFMEFDKIEDNMIVVKEGKKYVMAIECQGVNYDLMSGIEKNGVEEGFVQFLNTLRHPIQLYIQTRKINLDSSIQTYKKRVEGIKGNLFNMTQKYNQMVETERYSQEEAEKAFFEITKQRNLYEYGKDIIRNTERMSLNKNILNKKYYIIISYYTSELGKSEVDKEELLSIAFSELYTRAQSVIRAISSCGVNGKILNSMELSELLYVAYNRDDSEILDIKNAIRSEYDSLYSTAPDVLEKKMNELDKVISEKAMNKVTKGVEMFKSKSREKVEKKENSIEELADEMAMLILEENREYLGSNVIDEIIKEKSLEGGEQGEKEKTKSRTRKNASAK